MADTVPFAYRLPFIPFVYDAINALLWWPAGIGRLRAELVRTLGVRPGDRALELGCGSGRVTERLCDAGAEVTALDRSRPMLRRTAKRAPSANTILGEAQTHTESGYAHIVLAFVLHELPVDSRRELLAHAATLLAPHGRIGILEWELPPRGPRRTMWRAVIRAIEGRGGLDVVDGRLEADITHAGLSIQERHMLASGRAQVVIASPDAHPMKARQ